MSEFHTRTIKLKLRVISEDKKAAWKRIRQITSDAWKAANWIASGQYLNDQLVRRLYARRKIDAQKDTDAVARVEGEFQSVFGTKRQATTERDIKEAFPDLPPCVTNPMNQVVVASYTKEKQDMLRGKRSLRTYHEGMPVTTTKASIEFSANDSQGHDVLWKLGREDRVLFDIFYGRDKANNRLTVQRILDEEDDYCAPQIQLKDRDLFLLLPVKEPERKPDLDPNLSVGVDLGLVVPAYVALSKGEARRAIGSAEDFLRTRMQMQSRRRRLQRSLKATRGGRGRSAKMKALDRIEEKEKAFARTYNHFVSKTVVDFAIQHRAGVIKMEMLEGYGTVEPASFVLRNWSYFDLQKDIDYKAKRVGITVVKVDPYHTSQTCSQCGHYEEGQRQSQSEFVCAKCGTKLNADYNAALNIARSEKVVKSKEQCEYHKRNTSQEEATQEQPPE
jgi:putative transposase